MEPISRLTASKAELMAKLEPGIPSKEEFGHTQREATALKPHQIPRLGAH